MNIQKKSVDCDICCDTVDEQRIVKCDLCHKGACNECFQRYLLMSTLEPNCMHCGKLNKLSLRTIISKTEKK